MKAYFKMFDCEMEMNEENINRAEKEVDEMSGNYCNYILSVTWDEERKMPMVFADGPWEC